MVLKPTVTHLIQHGQFENDVKTYGTQTNARKECETTRFENDVKTYGTQTWDLETNTRQTFENDVKTYGTQTIT